MRIVDGEGALVSEDGPEVVEQFGHLKEQDMQRRLQRKPIDEMERDVLVILLQLKSVIISGYGHQFVLRYGEFAGELAHNNGERLVFVWVVDRLQQMQPVGTRKWLMAFNHFDMLILDLS